jgi:hypothetical protein
MCVKANFSILVICYYTMVLQWAIMLMCVKADFSILVISLTHISMIAHCNTIV